MACTHWRALISGLILLGAALTGLPSLAAEPALTFHGAAGSIGGSCHLLETGRERLLLDCGAFLGEGLEYRNADLPFRAGEIDGVVLSHAHLDHSGLVPLLYGLGFRGPTLCARPTRSLLEVMWGIQTRLRSAPSEDPRGALAGVRELPYGRVHRRPTGTEIRLHRAGHILGAAWTEIAYGPPTDRRTLVFSGDLGAPGGAIVAPADRPERADFVVVESTYGGRRHTDARAERERFWSILRQAALEGGVVLVPSFVLARTQKVLAYVREGMELGRVPRDLTVYLDSPSATRLTAIHAEHGDALAEPYRRFALAGPAFDLPRVAPVGGGKIRPPALILAPTADLTAGSARKHLARYAPRSDAHIVFVSGYQPPGSPADRLVRGDRELRLGDRLIAVRARVHELAGFSGHADQEQILNWLGGIQGVKQAFVVHGRPEGSRALAAAIRERLGWAVTVPELDGRYRLP